MKNIRKIHSVTAKNSKNLSGICKILKEKLFNRIQGRFLFSIQGHFFSVISNEVRNLFKIKNNTSVISSLPRNLFKLILLLLKGINIILDSRFCSNDIFNIRSITLHSLRSRGQNLPLSPKTKNQKTKTTNNSKSLSLQVSNILNSNNLKTNKLTNSLSTMHYALNPSKSNFAGFTLVELIVVISILAILGTIAFVSFGGYSSSARDSNRITNVSLIDKGIGISIAAGKNINTFDTLTGANIVIVGSGGTISFTGFYDNIGTKFLTSIGVSGEGLLNDSFQTYKYTYLPDNKFYQVSATLENQPGSAWIENRIYESENEGIVLIISEYLQKTFGIQNKYNFLNSDHLSWIPTFVGMTEDVRITDFLNSQLSVLNSGYAATSNSGYAWVKGNFPVNSASGGYIVGIIPADDNEFKLLTPNPDGTRSISGTGSDVAISSAMVVSGGNSTPTPSCSDGIKNQDETGIDCGGTCGACTIYSCTGTLVIANANITNITGLIADTSYQTSNSSNSCYYTCKENYSGTNCETYSKFPGEDGIAGNSDDCDQNNITLANGQIWSACNLGATIAYNGSNAGTYNASSSSTRGGDDSVNGKLYQWGRNKGFSSSDTSQLSTQLSSNPNGSDTFAFVWNSTLTNYDWLNPQIDDIWGGSSSDSATLDGQTDKTLRKGPCPAGWHVPSAKEFQDACTSINNGTTCTNGMANTSVRTTLQLPYAGYRDRLNGLYSYQGTYGIYWSSSPSTTKGFYLNLDNSNVRPTSNDNRAYGFSVRCIKD